MALVRFASFVEAVSGRIDNEGVVYTSSRGQAVLRSFTQPANPSTSEQAITRALFSAATKRWGQTLTDSQRNAWESWAAANPVVNRFGKTVARTGLTAYVQLNTLRQMALGTWGDSAPTMAAPAPVTDILDLRLENGSPSIDVNLRNVYHGNTSLTDKYLLVRVTPVIPLPSIRPAASNYRLIEGPVAGSFQGLLTSGSSYAFDGSRFELATGDRIGVTAQIMTTEGNVSTPYTEIVTVTEA